MRLMILGVALILAAVSTALPAPAEPAVLEVAVSYRERVALPPDAQLELQLLGVSPAAARSKRIASQRVAISSVPMRVSLNYDPQIVSGQDQYILVARIWSGDEVIFRTTAPDVVLDEMPGDRVEMWLSQVTENDTVVAPPVGISGIDWIVTEIGGESWGADEPATLAISGENGFSIFGGCNRFSGQLFLLVGEIAFPQDFAGTLMACSDDAEAWERRFIGAIRKASGYVRYGTGLVLVDPAGKALLHFVKRPE